MARSHPHNRAAHLAATPSCPCSGGRRPSGPLRGSAGRARVDQHAAGGAAFRGAPGGPRLQPARRRRTPVARGRERRADRRGPGRSPWTPACGSPWRRHLRASGADGEVQVLLRTSEDGQTWSRWYEVALERAAEERRRGEGVHRADLDRRRPLRAGARARAAGAGAAPARLRDVRVVAINSTEDADTASALVGVVRRAAATVAGFHLTSPAAAMTTKPKIVTRAEWGANESWRSGSPDYAPVKMAFVHHTDSGNSYTALAGAGHRPRHLRLPHQVAALERHRLQLPRSTATAPSTRGATAGSRAASSAPRCSASTPAARASPSSAPSPTPRLRRRPSPPWSGCSSGSSTCTTSTRWAQATLVCGYGQKYATGQQVRFPAIAGHRDANYTDCPGGRLYAQLPNIRKVVARTGQPKIYGFIAGAPAISPNGDGVRDRVTSGSPSRRPAAWTLEIRDAAGKLVRHMGGEGKVVEATWGGRDDDGDALHRTACTRCGPARPAPPARRARPRDTCASTRSRPGWRARPSRPTPSARTATARTTSTTLALPRRARPGPRALSVVDADGAVLRRVTGWKGVAAGRPRR